MKILTTINLKFTFFSSNPKPTFHDVIIKASNFNHVTESRLATVCTQFHICPLIEFIGNSILSVYSTEILCVCICISAFEGFKCLFNDLINKFNFIFPLCTNTEYLKFLWGFQETSEVVISFRKKRVDGTQDLWQRSSKKLYVTHWIFKQFVDDLFSII